MKPIKNDDFSVNNVNILGRNVVPQNALAKDADNQLKQSHYIGTALIVHKNKIILQKGYGYADAKTKRLNDAATLFQIASIQKGLTATLVMKEIESGKLSFDTK
ncbi:MAG: serine hydrolase, partial [Leuconostoc falkenbergense]